MLHIITGKFQWHWPAITLPFLITIASAQASDTLFEFNLPAQPLPRSLEQFQKITGINVVYASKELADHYSPALHGRYTPQQAMQMLLAACRTLQIKG